MANFLRMKFNMFWIGNGNYNSYVRKDMVTAISDYAIAENKRKCKEAKEKYLLSDYSCGGKKESVVFLSNGEVFISSIPAKELVEIWNDGSEPKEV